MISSPFMEAAFDSQRRIEVVGNAVGILSQVSSEGCTLVGTGVSGTLLLCPIAMQSGFPCTLVRKEGVKSHSKVVIEGEVNYDSFVILDDFIDTGQTVRRICAAMRAQKPMARLAGIILFNDSFDYMHELWEDEFECWIRSI